MKKNRTKAIFADALKRFFPAIITYIITILSCGIVFLLYDLQTEAFSYALILTGCFLLIAFVITLYVSFQRARKREYVLHGALAHWTSLPEAKTLAEADAQEMIRCLVEELQRVRLAYEKDKQADADYYTTWVHQVKTPIAVLRLMLGAKESDENRALETELFRIEQYVDMVLQYLRLGSQSNDLVIREYELDTLIRESIRKYAPQFVHRKLALQYEATSLKIVTDKKWFSCILDQLLSNAVKYTPSGSITICVEGRILKVTDTGIGIAADELPRIFEKGYTGSNGRLEKKSSGLGLYLCKRAADLLSIPVHAESAAGSGSTFSLDLTNTQQRVHLSLSEADENNGK